MPSRSLVIAFLALGSAGLPNIQPTILPTTYTIAQNGAVKMQPGQQEEFTIYEASNYRVCVENNTRYIATVIMVFNGKSRTFKLNNKQCFTPSIAGKGYVHNVGDVPITMDYGKINCNPTGPC